MKLIVFLSLAWMISNTAETLQCLGAPGPCYSADDWCATETTSFQGENPSKHVERFCLAPFLCAAHNQIVSFSDARLSVAKYLHCCRTDGCNHQDFPYPDPGKPNGLRCLTCTGLGPDHVCNSTVECVGTQDRCLDVYVKHGDGVLPYVGCVSSNVCDLVSQLKLRKDFAARFNYSITPRVPGSSFCSSVHITPRVPENSSCCSVHITPRVPESSSCCSVHITPRVPGSSFCSSAGIVNPDFAALLLGLFTMFVFHNQC